MNVSGLKEELKKNNLGESVTIVAAVKNVPPEDINHVIREGIADIGENRVQEFIEKYDKIAGGNRHFIGHLQTNKVKYLIGKTYLYQSADRLPLIEEIERQSAKKNVVSDILMQVNIAKEESKGGFFEEEVLPALEIIRKYCNISIKGLMAMFPLDAPEESLIKYCLQMRGLYDIIKKENGKDNIDFKYLSMGMSGDYRTAVNNGSNMVRLGRVLFR